MNKQIKKKTDPYISGGRTAALVIAFVMVWTFPVASFAAAGDPAASGPMPVSRTSESLSQAVDLSHMTEGAAVADELLVLAEEGASARKLDRIADKAGASLEDVEVTEEGTKLATVELDSPGDAQAVAEEMAEAGEIIHIQPNYIYSIQAGEGTKEQWYMRSDYSGATRTFKAWGDLGIGIAGTKVKVAVIDTGVDLDHSDLSGVVLKDKCVTFNGGRRGALTAWDGSNDDDGHGTGVCGIIAAVTDDNRGISGMARNRAELIAIDATYDKEGHLKTQDLVLAIDYAVASGANIINMSLGGLGYDYILETTINNALAKGVLCVCAAGNESSQAAATPSDCPGAISVMAHDQYSSRAYFSNYGPEKDVSAPGVGITSTDINNGYSVDNGTSFAAPVVTGLAALLKSEEPGLTPRQLKNLIYTSSGSGSFSGFGFGRIDTLNALTNRRGSSAPSAILLNRNAVSMYPDYYFYLEYAIYPGKASRYADTLTFESSNPAVATVDKQGRVVSRGGGKATITAKCGGLRAACQVTVYKYGNTMTVKGKKVKVKYSKLRKKAQTIAKAKAMNIKNARGKVTYAKKSGSKKIKVNKKTGKITIKKKTKKGTYKLRVKVSAAGNSIYNPTSKTVTVTIRVK